MKKIVLIIALVLVGALLFGCTAVENSAVGPQGPVGPKGDTGLTGPQGIQGSAGISGYEIITETIEDTVVPGIITGVSAKCPDEKKVLGGGCEFPTGLTGESKPFSAIGDFGKEYWAWQCMLDISTESSGSQTVTTYAICANVSG
jgi:hypothetical protein